MIYIENAKILSKVVAKGNDIVIISKGSEVYWKAPFVIENPTNQPATITLERVSTGTAPTADFYYCIGRKPGEYKHYVNNSSGTTYSSFTIPAHQNMFIYSTEMRRWGTGVNNRNTWKTGFRNLNFTGNIYALLKNNILIDLSFAYLFYGSDIEVAPNLPATTLAMNCYNSMFRGCTSLTEAPNLPATTLKNGCYGCMFKGCTSLTTAPVLRATTLATQCYQSMFAGCTSLTDAPILPAETLSNNCYEGMFSGCTSLTAAPELPATTLRSSCYYSMFSGCTSLTEAPTLPATRLFTYCYQNMFEGCTSLTTAPELPATTLAFNCYDGMFSGCTSLTTAPNLPATTLAVSCYYGMFEGCTNLTTAPVLSSTTLATYCYTNMFSGCTSLIDPPVLPATTLKTSCYSGMFSGCTNLTEAPVLRATTLATSCYQNMFTGCTSLTDAPILPAFLQLANSCYKNMFSGCTSLVNVQTDLPAETLKDNCYEGMFQGCTSLVEAPVLPAITLKTACYNSMFSGCSSLNYIEALFTTDITNTDIYTKNWVNGVAATGTFIKNKNATWQNIGLNGIPENWVVYNKEYLTIESHEDNNIISLACTVKEGETPDPMTIYYSTNEGATWNEITTTTTTTLATLNTGDKIIFKGNNPAYYIEYNNNSPLIYYAFQSSKTVDLRGNIMSLVYGDNFIKENELTARCAFRNIFYGLKVVDASGLYLVSQTLTPYCYFYMFYKNTTLTTPPELPATSLAERCYQFMFQDCTRLTEAPELPATTLAQYCYSGMFSGCTSLTTVPTLPATTLAPYCYNYMFSSCTALTNAPELPSTTLASKCYRGMFYCCTALTTAPELPSTTLASNCYSDMFSGCTSLTEAPELPATTLDHSCYDYMFVDCTSLTVAPELPATTLANYCYNGMFSNCTSLTTAPELPATTLAYACYNNMFTGCRNLNYIKALFTTDIADTDSYTNDWVNGVAATGTFVKNKNATWNRVDASGIPTGWTVETDAPYEEQYFTIEALEDECYVNLKKATSNNYITGKLFYYSTDNGLTWNSVRATYSNGAGNTFIMLNAHDKLLLKSDVYPGSLVIIDSNYYYNPTTITASKNHIFYGNIMSLGHGDNFVNQTTISESKAFSELFFYDTNLTDISNLVLPATKLSPYCYEKMFQGTGITNTPTLPATILHEGCYSEMFRFCTSLTEAPELPATSLIYRCYRGMFRNCTSLTTAPELPSITLAPSCYRDMFRNCSNLNYIKAMFTTTITSNTDYTLDWVSGVAGSGTFVKNHEATWIRVDASGIPSGWTVITE